MIRMVQMVTWLSILMMNILLIGRLEDLRLIYIAHCTLIKTSPLLSSPVRITGFHLGSGKI